MATSATKNLVSYITILKVLNKPLVSRIIVWRWTIIEDEATEWEEVGVPSYVPG